MSVGEKFRRLGADTIGYGLTSAISKSVALLLLPIYARQLTPAEFGIYDLAIVMSTILSLGAGLELHGALKRYFYEGDEAQRSRLISTLYIAVGVTGMLSAAFAATVLLLLRQAGLIQDVIGLALLVAVVAAVFKAIIALSEVQLRMERKVGRFAVIQGVNLIIAAAVSLYLLLIVDWGAIGLVLGYTVGAAVTAVVATVWVRDRLRLTFDWPMFKRAFRYSAPLVPSVASSYLRRFGDRFVILAFLPFASLGIYALGYRVAMIPMLFITAFQMSWSPLAISLLGDPDQEEVYTRALRYYALLVGGLGMVVSAIAPEIVGILGAESYASAVPLVGWIVGATILQGAGTFVTVGAMVAERTWIHLAGSAVGGVAALLAMLLLVPAWGLHGAAIGAFAGALLGRLATYRLSQQVYPLSYDGHRIIMTIVLFIVMQALLLPLADALPAGVPVLNRIFVLVVCLAVTGLLLLDEKDWRKLRVMVNWSRV